MMNIEFRALKDYKGFGIDKCWYVNYWGDRKGDYFYLVSEDEDYIGEEYKSLAEAKKFIDSIA